jgi:hypothetical protein
MSNSIQFIQTTPEQLALLISTEVQNEIKEIIKSFTPCQDRYILTREQACDFLQINSSTLWHWTNNGKVKAYGLAGKRYYKKNELLEALIPLQTRKRSTLPLPA